MITVINRPLGHKLTDEELEGEGFDLGGLIGIATPFAHGLSDGDYVYIQSEVEEYNGFKYVDAYAYDTFRLRESDTGSFIAFVQSTDITYRVAVLNHGWVAAAQPIVYELESNISPVNEIEDNYTPTTVSSQTDAEGYTDLHLSAPLSDPQELLFIELVGTGPLAGVYQIFTVLQPWEVIINLAYSASNSFSGYTVVKYYNNYCINVNVYCGLDTDHRWYDRKPYELVATLRFTPNEDNRVKFSISDIVKGYLNTRNNLTLGSLPNNLDFFTGFYIEYFESYDDSDGTEISTYSSTPISDKPWFEGKAVNADMPFKSLYNSHLSDYLHEDVYLAQWLVLQTRPVAVVGYYFDLSFLNSIPGVDILININKSSTGQIIAAEGFDYELDFEFPSGTVDETETITIVNPGIGVIRVPITPEAGFNEYCIYAYVGARSGEEEVTETDFFDLSTWVNHSEGLTDWTTGIMNPFVNIVGPNSEFLYQAYATTAGQVYTYNYDITVANSDPGTKTFQILFLDAAFLAVGFSFIDIPGDGTYIGSVDITPSTNGVYIAVRGSSIGLQWDLTVIHISIDLTTTETVEIPEEAITETICIEVIEECDSTFIPDDSEIRLTEDGDFRILE